MCVCVPVHVCMQPNTVCLHVVLSGEMSANPPPLPSHTLHKSACYPETISVRLQLSLSPSLHMYIKSLTLSLLITLPTFRPTPPTNPSYYNHIHNQIPQALPIPPFHFLLSVWFLSSLHLSICPSQTGSGMHQCSEDRLMELVSII